MCNLGLFCTVTTPVIEVLGFTKRRALEDIQHSLLQKVPLVEVLNHSWNQILMQKI